MVLNRVRFLTEQHSFNALSTMHPVAQDGAMANALTTTHGWKFLQSPVQGCQFIHAPTHQSCEEESGFWLDSPVLHDQRCLNSHELDELFQTHQLDNPYLDRDSGCIRYDENNYRRVSPADT